MTGFIPIADRVYVLRHPVLDVNTTLVCGQGGALVVDTLSTTAQAVELFGAVRAITADPLTVVNTHHHFDHSFGNAVFADDGAAVWAHEWTATELAENGERWRRYWYLQWLPRDAELATGIAGTPLHAPDRRVLEESTVDIGGREVGLHHLGRGHTAGDLVVRVPDADVIVAGDLVEQGAPPDFYDAYPMEWPETLASLLRMASPATVVVPGHGAVVDPAFVRAQHAELAKLDWLIRDGHADGAPAAEVAARSPFAPEASLVAVRRGYAELTGRA